MAARDASILIDLTTAQRLAFEAVAYRALQLAEPFPMLLTVEAAFARQALRQLVDGAKLTRGDLAAVIELGEVGIRAVEALALIQNTSTAEQALNALKAAHPRR